MLIKSKLKSTPLDIEVVLLLNLVIIVVQCVLCRLVLWQAHCVVSRRSVILYRHVSAQCWYSNIVTVATLCEVFWVKVRTRYPLLDIGKGRLVYHVFLWSFVHMLSACSCISCRYDLFGGFFSYIFMPQYGTDVCGRVTFL